MEPGLTETRVASVLDGSQEIDGQRRLKFGFPAHGFAVRPLVLATPDLPEMPAVPGCYALLLAIESDREVAVGRLGEHALGAGLYAYCGSAQGPGGLRARVGRHLRADAAIHWHVDRLRSVARLEHIWIWPGALRAFECEVASILAALPGCDRPIPRFGSSDCRCAGHLVRLPGAGSPSRPPVGY